MNKTGGKGNTKHTAFRALQDLRVLYRINILRSFQIKMLGKKNVNISVFLFFFLS